MNRTTLTILSLAITAAPTLAQLGPIAPPPGPVQNTFPSLEQLENRIVINQRNTPGDAAAAFVISEPGSYILDRSLEIADRIAVDIRSSNVTLDLNGHSIRTTGIYDAANPFHGVRIDRDDSGPFVKLAQNVTVKNGVISNCIGDGIFSTQFRTNIRDLILHNNFGRGATLFTYGIIDNCNFYANGGSLLDTEASELKAERDNLIQNSIFNNTRTSFTVEIDDDNTIRFCKIQTNSASIRDPLRITGSNNRIDSNDLDGGDIIVEGRENVIIRNTINSGIVDDLGAANFVGPTNSVTSPWTNFIN